MKAVFGFICNINPAFSVFSLACVCLTFSSQVSLLLRFFIYRDFFGLLRALAFSFLPLLLVTHRALCTVRIRRRDLREEDGVAKAQ